MPIMVTGSIATDHLMRFPGRFADQFVAEALDRVSLSFLVDDLTVRRGGVAANIAYGLAQLGTTATLVGAVGHDFADYRSWLERNGVDCTALYVSTRAHTARFVCTTDDDMCQIASFYPGAMAEAGGIDLGALFAGSAPDLVLVGADEPAAMLRHADACRRHGVPMAADPSQQLARMSGEDVLRFIDGAAYLLTNEYEHHLLEARTGLDADALLDRVGRHVTTLGADGVRIRERGRPDVHVPAAPCETIAEPTGVGDAFRAGFFAALARRLPLVTAAQVGCQLAVEVLRVSGPQEYALDWERFAADLSRSYGAPAAAQVRRAWTAAPATAS
ncbi:carbohydrate kinase family protein [Nucisporomicrobium flavum]|uniref:carbohydrate kinase family protein n=1 Tax=Nucisporomicrobium flavum TaxID=2785915 RepID=UPI003C2BC147